MKNCEEYLAHLRMEIRDIRPEKVLAECPCKGDREVTEAPFIDMLARYVYDLRLITCDMSRNDRRRILRSMWMRLLEYYTPECGVSRANSSPYVLVALAWVETVPARFPEVRELVLDVAATWMCEGSHNTHNFTRAQAFARLSGLLDRTLVPPLPQNHFGCVGCTSR